MIVRTADEDLLAHLNEVRDALTDGARPQDNDHLNDLSLTDVIDRHWSPADGWHLDVIDPGNYYVLFLLSHPTRGIAATLMGAAWRTGQAAQPADLTTWDALPSDLRAQHIYFAHHAHGATRLDLLDALEAARAAGDMSTLDYSMLNRLFTSSHFMDDPTTLMCSLGTYDDLRNNSNLP